MSLSFAAAAVLSAAPTESKQSAASTTVIALKIETREALAIQTSFQQAPPVLTVVFPSKTVVSSLPEQSIVGEGAIRSITAVYEPSRSKQPARFLQSLKIALSGAFPYQVRSEAGHFSIEISHPASINSASVEVGVKGGTIVGQLARAPVSDRFRAMQEALAKATPVPWMMRLDLSPVSETPAPSLIQPPAGATIAAAAKQPAAKFLKQPEGRIMPRSSIRWHPAGMIVGFCLFMAAAAMAYFVLLRSTAENLESSGYLPSSTALIDQLVWRAFERQGFQLLSEPVFSSPISGTFRIIQKDGIKSAFFVVGQRAFLEKRAVDQVVRLMHGANLDQGILVASGAYTIPAQRSAKMHRLTLIGREQLTELVGVGAAGEFVTKQLEKQQSQLNEALGTLQQYSQELEALRQQRNEATWLLGEHKNQVAGLESQFAAVNEQLQRYSAELEHWQQEALILKKQWEESEWYLGESRARAEYLQSQVETLQSAMQRAEVAERRCAELEQGLQAARERETALQASFDQLKLEVASAQVFGERRQQARQRVQEAFIELLNGTSKSMFKGTVRDVSFSGIGLATDRELLDRIRFRLHLPGKPAVESRAEVVWQKPIDNTLGFVSGFRFLDLSEDVSSLLKTIAA